MSNVRPVEAGKLNYSVCIQFLFMHLVCLAAIWTGVSVTAVVVCLALYVVRMFAITAGFHRFFSHRTYQTGRIFGFLLAFTGTAAYQKGPLWWSSHHRRHHLHADTEDDLHSPLTRTLWRSHVGWFLHRESQATEWALISNLVKYRDLRLLDRFYQAPPAILAVGVFLLGSALQRYAPGLGTSGWQMLVWGFFISTVLLYHGIDDGGVARLSLTGSGHGCRSSVRAVIESAISEGGPLWGKYLATRPRLSEDAVAAAGTGPPGSARLARACRATGRGRNG